MAPRSRFTREETRERILCAAEELFSQVGFTKTTVTDIADALGMSNANVYKFFPSRAAIIEACAERNLVKLREKLRLVVEAEESAGDRLGNLVAAIIKFNRETFKNEQHAYRLIFACIEEKWESARKFDDCFISMLSKLLADGMRTGEFRRLEATATATVVFDCIRSVISPLELHHFTASDLDERSQAVVQFVLRALTDGPLPEQDGSTIPIPDAVRASAGKVLPTRQ
jgi:AcrR family transcriptional regulator